MPKIIENLEQKLIREAERQLNQSGYSAMTIRSVAAGCGVGVGTVYNYFPSKEALLAAYLLEDWRGCVAAIQAAGETADGPMPVARCIHDQLQGFAQRHLPIFRDEAAAVSFTGSVSPYHALLRSQLAAPLARFCPSEFAGEFIAEALLTWTMAGKDFDAIFAMIAPLFGPGAQSEKER